MGQAASPRAHLACGEASPLGRRQRPRSAGLITPQGRGTSVAERPRPEGQGGGWGRSQLIPIRDPTPKLQGPSAALPPALPWLRRGNWRARVAICPGLQGAAPDQRHAWDIVPWNIVPGMSAPSISVPWKSVPGKSVPGKSVPGKSAPGKSVPRNPCLGSRHAPASRGGRGLGGSANLAGDKADATRGYPCQPSGRCAHTEPA
jgi:hypothetical protein